MKTRPICLFAPFLLGFLLSCSDEDPVGPESPSVTITSPAAGSVHLEGAGFHLAGSASDPQDGPIPD